MAQVLMGSRAGYQGDTGLVEVEVQIADAVGTVDCDGGIGIRPT
jgi:hypothetical protein